MNDYERYMLSAPVTERFVPILSFPPKIQWLCQTDRLRWEEAALLMEIVLLSEKTGYCAPSYHYFSGIQTSLRTIKRRIESLERMGLITVSRKAGSTNRLTPVLPLIHASVRYDAWIFPLYKD